MLSPSYVTFYDIAMFYDSTAFFQVYSYVNTFFKLKNSGPHYKIWQKVHVKSNFS